MSKIIDRYASAIRSGNLRSSVRTTMSDSDVIGAVGLAGRGDPLGAALLRLFLGDNRASVELVYIMASKLHKKARSENIKLKREQAEDLAKAVLAWHRDGTCKTCKGHGYYVIPGTTTIGDGECMDCGGSGRIKLTKHFGLEDLYLAQWMLSDLDKRLSNVGSYAMQAIAHKLDMV